MKSKWIVFMAGLTVGCPFFSLQAQNQKYQGGAGDGYEKVSSLTVFLNGTSLAARYQGGDGDGYEKVSSLIVFLNGTSLADRYQGGTGDGYEKVSSLIVFLNGTSLADRYQGGTGDGYAKVGSSIILLDDVRYQGGDGDGYAKVQSDEVPLSPPDLAVIAKTASDSITVAGDTVTYTIIVKNSSSAAATGVVVSDTIPAGLTYVPESITHNDTVRTDMDGDDNTDFGVTAGNTVTVNIGAMAPAQQDTITFKVTVNATVNGSIITNTATVAADQDNDPNNNSASVDVNAVVIINGKISAQFQLPFWNFMLKQFSFDLKLTNESTDTLCAPVFVEFDTIFTVPETIPTSVTVDNADGGGTGIGAFFDYSDSLGGDNRLDPGEMSKFKRWRFNDPDSINFFFFANVFGIIKPGPGDTSPVAKTTGNEPLRFYVDVKNGRLEQITGTTDVEEPTPEEESNIPKEFALQQNYPNPFNPETTIRYQLPQASEVNLMIYNVRGQLVRKLVSESREAGFHEIVWDARDDAGRSVPSGVYLYRIQAGAFMEVRKLMLLR